MKMDRREALGWDWKLNNFFTPYHPEHTMMNCTRRWSDCQWSVIASHRISTHSTFQSITVAAPMKWRWVQADGGRRWWRWWRNNTIDRQLAVSAWYNCWGEGGTCWRWSQGNCTGDSVTAVNDKCRLFVVLVAVVVVVERLRNVVQAHANTHLACRQLG